MASFPFGFWRLDPNFGPSGLGFNYGYQFDGTKGIDFGDNLDNDGTQAFSISFWTRDIANSEWIITKQSSRYEGLEINSDGSRKMGLSLGRTSTDRIACTSTNALPLNQWNHWVITYDGSKTVAGVKMYLNNVEETIVTIRDTFVGSSTNNGTFNIGSLVWSVNNWLDCRLDDVQYYDFVLNSTQVNDIYNSGYVTAPTAAPIHHWKLGEDDTWDGSNWDVVDSVGSIDGTSSNMVETDRKLGVAYSMLFDGVDEEVTFSTTVGDLKSDETWSISFWGYNLSGTVIGKHDGSKGYALWVNGGIVYMRMASGGLSQMYADADGFSSWKHIVITYNGQGLTDTNNFNIYSNTTLKGVTLGGGGASGEISNSDNFRVGASNGYISNGSGSIMYLSLYDTELSQADVTALYNSGVPVDPRDVSLSPSFFVPLGGPNDSFSTNWTIVDEVNGNNGTSVNMEESDKTSDTP